MPLVSLATAKSALIPSPTNVARNPCCSRVLAIQMRRACSLARRYCFALFRCRHCFLRRGAPITIIHFGKDIVEPFDAFQPWLVHPRAGQLLVQGDKTKEMGFDALPRVFGTRAGAQN